MAFFPSDQAGYSCRTSLSKRFLGLGTLQQIKPLVHDPLADSLGTCFGLRLGELGGGGGGGGVGILNRDYCTPKP